MNSDDKDLPDDTQELEAEYLQIRGELQELESDPQKIEDRVTAILAQVPRLREIWEGTYSGSDPGISGHTIFDDAGEFLGWSLDIEEEEMTSSERLAANEIRELRLKRTNLTNRLGLVRIKAASLGITLPDEEQAETSEAVDPISPEPPQIGHRKPRRKKAVPEDVATRRALVKAIRDSHPKAKGKNLDQLTCEQLDSRKVAIPMKWRPKYRINNWEEGYKNPEVKPLIQKMFSSDRKKLE